MKLRINALALAALLSIGASASTLKERCMDMLYQYMPAADSANYSRDFFSHNVDMSLKARNEMPWGQTVPEREFMHFVVPVRVNNEALDNHREEFYNELKDRVKGLSMRDAILEINHWCHEKVTYQPSDGRTHSPLASVSSAIGRCGEESTFGVAALRAMGIPARQVYTPRWAHTDDNHAWVEAWADGKWYFLGACEPEPVLNLGWFNSPASRGMLMHARVFGPYQGSEEILSSADGITDINVTDHYASIDTLHVTVTDTAGRPIENAKVSFRVYNYAEFYPVATKKTDSQGKAQVVTGLGDMIVWASDGKNFNFAKANAAKDKQLTLVIDPQKSYGSLDIDIIPPAPKEATVVVTPEMRAANDRRFAHEDSIRNAYTATFVKAMPNDRVSGVLAKSRGNHQTIKNFIDSSTDKDKALALLENLTEKDLTDVKTDVLADHIKAADNGSKLFAPYIMSPRIATEELTPFRSFFLKNVPSRLQKKFKANPSALAEWVKSNIDATDYWYPISVTMNPAEVWKLRHTSAPSRDIFFVALARSMGIPARINPVTSHPQWADKSGNWQEAKFSESAKAQNVSKHKLSLSYSPNSTVDDPLYYTHFTISKIENGEPTLLTYGDFEPLSQNLGKGAELEDGEYMIVTGQRLANGGVLSHVDFVNLNSDVAMPLTLRSDSTLIQVIGSFDSESRFTRAGKSAEQSILATTGRGYFVVGILRPGHEPSNHALRDLGTLARQLEENGTPIVLLTDNAASLAKLDKEITDALPSTVTLGADTTGKIEAALHQLAESSNEPVIIIADTFNRVVFITSGYTIGLGQKLLDTLRRL